MDQEENKILEQQTEPEAPEETDGPQEQPPHGWDTYEMLHDVVYMLAAITIIFVFFFRLVGVSGSSMYPTFYDRDYLVLESNFFYRTPKNGDIVVLTVPDDVFEGPIVKRVIATEGQSVDIDFDAGIVYVDGVALEEPYTFEPTYNSFAQFGSNLDYPVTVPEDCVFVMGDNRNHSSDSRRSDVGCLGKECISGRVLLRIFPARRTNEFGEITGGREIGRIGTVK